MPSGVRDPASAPRQWRPWTGWVLTFGILIVVGLVAWSVVTKVMQNAPEPIVTPTVVPALADVNGRWCSTDPALEEAACVTIALPSVLPDGAPELERFVLPQGASSTDSPTTFDYDIAANMGACWRTGLMGAESISRLTFTYCPAGAESGEPGFDAHDTSVERLFITQDAEPYPYLREAPVAAESASHS